MLSLRVVITTAVLLITFCALAPAGGPFLELTLDEALARARAEEKLVFIDFFATWCGPCNQLDSTTFADEKVIEWLGKHTVPLKIDVDREKDVAKRFHVNSMPTLILLRPDGTELDRIRGYQTGDQFLAAVGSVIEHPEIDAVARARKELAEGNWPEAMSRQKLATALAITGKNEEALGEYVKAMDSLGTDPMSRKYEVRLVREMCVLAESHQPARDHVNALRRQLVERIEAGEADTYDVDNITAIDSGLGQKEKTLELYTSLKEQGDIPTELLIGFIRSSRDVLLKDRQYEALEAESRGGLLFEALMDINTLERQRAWTSGDFSGMPAEQAEKMQQRYDALSEEKRTSMIAGFEKTFVGRIGEKYQIALGVGKADDAGVIARKLLEKASSAQVYHILAENALRSGQPTEADLGYAEKAVELDDGAHPEYEETRDGLLEHFGRTGGEESALEPGETPADAESED